MVYLHGGAPTFAQLHWKWKKINNLWSAHVEMLDIIDFSSDIFDYANIVFLLCGDQSLISAPVY